MLVRYIAICVIGAVSDQSTVGLYQREEIAGQVDEIVDDGVFLRYL